MAKAGQNRLGRLDEIIKKTAVNAEKTARRICSDIRGDVMRLSRDLEVHRRAADREKVEKAVRARIKRLNKELELVMAKALDGAVGAANGDSGLPVKYSADYTREILSLVQGQQGENLAAVYTRRMEQGVVTALRQATVATIQEAAVAGLTLSEQKKLMREKWEDACAKLGEAKFVDAGGHEWDSRDYFAMNVRTNAMRVYNDVLAGNVAADGGDLVQVSRHGDPGCRGCFPWEGRILSLTGKTKGYPTYARAREAGCFHPNCTHTLETVDEIVDADEIMLQRNAGEPGARSGDPMQDAFDLDVKRETIFGGHATRTEAVMAVRRSRLEAALRAGTVSEKAKNAVARLTDEQVSKLTDGVKVPRFETAKKGENVGWHKGSRGGRIVLSRNASEDEILDTIAPKDEKKKWEPTTELEKKTAEFAKRLGVAHTDEHLPLSIVNPHYKDGVEWQNNCQRCVPTDEMCRRGYPVTARPAPMETLPLSEVKGEAGVSKTPRKVYTYENDPMFDGLPVPKTMADLTDSHLFPCFEGARGIPFETIEDIARQMEKWGDGAVAQITFAYRRVDGTQLDGHTMVVRRENGITKFRDPQTKQESVSPDSFAALSRREKCVMNRFARIDNLPFSERAFLAMQKR